MLQFSVNERYATNTQTDKYRKNDAFSLAKCTRMYVEDHFGFGLIKIDPLFTTICAKIDVYIFVPCDVDL